MPFGFDPLQAEQDIKNYVDVQKIYVTVTMLHKKTGEIIPLAITWEDGRNFRIDKILEIRQGHSLKVFAPGWRYRCQTGKRIYYLYYDGEHWYVEKK